MARSLTGDLDDMMLSIERRPAFKVEVYDILSGGDEIGDIVRDLTLATLTGPRDFTSDTMNAVLTEVASDFATTGIAVSNVTITVADPTGKFDPLLTQSDPTGDGRWLRRGNVVRISEGDERIDEADWPITFTGKIVGQAGVDINRTGGGRGTVTLKAVGREADYLNIAITTADFGQGASYISIATTIATTDMGLDSDEIDWVTWGAQTNGHLSLQFVELPPLVAIANLMMVDGLMPRFDGEGKLSQSLGLVTQNPDRIYSNQDILVDIVRPFNESSPANSVTVLGLDAAMVRRDQPRQPLIELHITTGYFTWDERIEVYWSEDKRQLADNISTKIVKSVNGGLFVLGGGETISLIDSPTGDGSIGAVLEISTGFAPYLIIFFTILYVVLAAIPDAVITALFGGTTIPVGRIIQAFALASILLLMTKIGKGHYIFRGEPFEFVYQELKAIAEADGLTSETRIEITINNQVIQTQSDCDDVARNQLFRLQALGSVRQIAQSSGDLRLTPDDVFEIPGARQFQVVNFQRTLVRPPPGQAPPVARLQCSELTALGLE